MKYSFLSHTYNLLLMHVLALLGDDFSEVNKWLGLTSQTLNTNKLTKFSKASKNVWCNKWPTLVEHHVDYPAHIWIIIYLMSPKAWKKNLALFSIKLPAYAAIKGRKRNAMQQVFLQIAPSSNPDFNLWYSVVKRLWLEIPLVLCKHLEWFKGAWVAVALWEVKSSSNDVKFPANVHANTKLYAKSGFHFVLLTVLGTQSCLLVLIC